MLHIPFPCLHILIFITSIFVISFPSTGKKIKFLNTQQFTQLADPKIKRKITPIKNWTKLNEGKSYCVDVTHEIEQTIDEKNQIRYSAGLYNEEMKLMNV